MGVLPDKGVYHLLWNPEADRNAVISELAYAGWGESAVRLT
jgi:hypothetical protein